MKHLIFAIILTLPLQLIGQSEDVITTEREYNYLTKGYGEQVVNQGGDIIKGYELVKAGGDSRHIPMKGFDFTLELLLRTETKQICAGLITVKSEGSGRTYYLCVPLNNVDLTARFYRDLDNLDGNLNRELSKVMSIFFLNTISLTYEMAKAQDSNIKK